MVLVDANVLIDVFTDDPGWRVWSAEALRRAALQEELAINPIIYAEIAAGFGQEAQLERALKLWPLVRLELPYAAGFLAAQAFVRYRREGGTRRAPLPDFYIGAHAQVQGLGLLTRDATRFRSYFPELRLMSPGTEP